MTTETKARPSRADELPAPKYRRLFGHGKATWIQYAIFIAAIALVLAPLLPTLYQSLIDRPLYDDGGLLTPANYVKLFTTAGFGKVVLDSLYFAALTTVIAVVLSLLLAVLVVRVRMPGGRALGSLLLWPIYISPLVMAFGFILMYGPAGFVSVAVQNVLGVVPWNLYSIPGMAFAEAVTLVPIGFLYCSGALKLADPSLEAAARTCGARPLRILWSVVLPMVRPAILYSALLIFSTSIEELSIPLLLGRPAGINLFSSFIYINGLAQANPDYGLVGAASVVTLGVMAILIVIQGISLRNARRFVAVRGKASRPRLLELGRLRWVGFVIAVLYIIFGPLLPILGLLLRAFTQLLTPLVNPLTLLTLDNFTLIFDYPAYTASIRNSLFIALIGAVVTTLFVSVVVLVARRSTFRFNKVLEFGTLTPQVIPGLIIGIGFFWAFALIGPLNAVNGTLLALIIAFGTRSMPAAFGAIAPLVMQIGEELDDAARTLGADWWRTFSRILFKLIVPAMFSALVLLFVQMFKEYTPAVFLANADSQVIGTTTLQLWLNGNSGAVAALSCIQIAITAVFVIIAGKVLKVRSYA
ncbi:iron ABC transporter permease [Paenarthrobacter sp. Z7-10]|uniref:ABC transporter permease n=1 Tax=Paenarthrobacter sp. Z7-10 TaxID=2787635 RepID=UPI0022A92D37|nr:iron ABC transporter permease [Paenarthrobacter sp. Z7-10]MCZ2403672.1 iron ABC transporter permease [Paenarthrobacter sp. Z7-10]